MIFFICQIALVYLVPSYIFFFLRRIIKEFIRMYTLFCCKILIFCMSLQYGVDLEQACGNYYNNWNKVFRRFAFFGLDRRYIRIFLV